MKYLITLALLVGLLVPVTASATFNICDVLWWLPECQEEEEPTAEELCVEDGGEWDAEAEECVYPPTEEELCEEDGGTWNSESEECEYPEEEEEEEEGEPEPTPTPSPSPSPTPQPQEHVGGTTSGRILEKCQWPQYFQLPQCEDGIWEEPTPTRESILQEIQRILSEILKIQSILWGMGKG